MEQLNDGVPRKVVNCKVRLVGCLLCSVLDYSAKQRSCLESVYLLGRLEAGSGPLEVAEQLGSWAELPEGLRSPL